MVLYQRCYITGPLISFVSALLFYAAAVTNVSADYVFLEQLDATVTSGVDIPSASNWADQVVACEDVPGVIKDLTFMINTNSAASGGVSYVARVRGKDFFGGDNFEQLSNSVSGEMGTTKEYTFNFSPEINLITQERLCKNNPLFIIGIKQFNSNITGKLLGSNNHNAYRTIDYRCFGCGSLADLYFKINAGVIINSSPSIDEIPDMAISEGIAVNFTVNATDVDNDQLSYSINQLPPGATFLNGVFNWTPGYNQAGEYDVTFIVSDGELIDAENVNITVLNTNRAPELAVIGNQTISENQQLQFSVSATDPDGDGLTYTANNLPAGATFVGNTFSWTPGYSQAGNYENIEFVATDNGSPLELAVELIAITVGDVNRAPELSNPGPRSVLEGQSLSFTITAVDPDGNTVLLTATGMPDGASFDASTGIFSWIPTNAQSGNYTVTFVAIDNGLPYESGSVDVAITVGDDPTPIEQSQLIINTVVSFNLPNNVTNSYMANLQKVEPFIMNGQVQPAINQLNSFINKVNIDYNQGKITLTQKNQLVSIAQMLILDLQ